MNIYNTKTRKIEKFVPNSEVVTMYTCGPTVYYYAHIGNLRTYIMEDVFERALNYFGYKVKRCMNITDIGHLSSDADTGEDKMVEGAIKEHKSVMEIAQMYTNAFFDDALKLNIKKPELVVPATTCIDEYIKIIDMLIKKDYAYVSNGNVYFDVSKLYEYYVLTNHKQNEMIVGSRSDVNEDNSKRNQADFVLWFTKSKFNDQELKWNSPWGLGYPGWHIECSGISIKYLGEYLDIHCGGVDNIFPHHTNEIAQSESFLGHKWCNYWFHSEHLLDSRGKMSKSNGDSLNLALIESKGYDPLAYRLFCLGSHYRKQLVFSYEALDIAQNTYNKLLGKVQSLVNDGEADNNLIVEYDAKFKEAIGDDLNTSKALTVMYDVLKMESNDSTKIKLIKMFDEVLGLSLFEVKEVDSSTKDYIISKIEERKVAKENKNYELADSIRKELEEKGIILKDTKEGTTYEIK
ncbi:MAG: cysteine--tRNA ligase [Bacilli bacterium]|nr:cysteine--tRNA ligase [Bacilli bacterium]